MVGQGGSSSCWPWPTRSPAHHTTPPSLPSSCKPWPTWPPTSSPPRPRPATRSWISRSARSWLSQGQRSRRWRRKSLPHLPPPTHQSHPRDVPYPLRYSKRRLMAMLSIIWKHRESYVVMREVGTWVGREGWRGRHGMSHTHSPTRRTHHVAHDDVTPTTPPHATPPRVT